MSAPPKPWESSRGSLQRQPVFPGGTQARTTAGQSTINGSVQPTSYVSGPGATLQSAGATPRPPPRPNTTMVSRPGVLGYGGVGGYGTTGMSGYSSSLSPYGMRSGYGSYGSYGSPYSSYGMMGGMGGYGSYGSGYGAYGSGYGGYGSSYGGYGGYGQNPYGQHDLENRFIQAAEESSRPAFESLQSLVHAFGSVSMMMESTFFAIHSSFRAVLGVAENFGRMRGSLAQVFSALTIFRAVRWAFIRLMQILRLKKPGEADKVWEELAGSMEDSSAAGAVGGKGQEPSSAWPIVMFMSLIMGGPYLIYKLLRSVQSSGEKPPQGRSVEEPWMSGQSPCYVSQADYGFEARQSDELSFSAGDVLAMAPAQQQSMRNHGWMLATRLKDAAGNSVPRPRPVGLVPINHFRTIYNRGQNASNSTSQTVHNIGISNVPVATANTYSSTSTPNPTDPFVNQFPAEVTQEVSSNSPIVIPPSPAVNPLVEPSATPFVEPQPAVTPLVQPTVVPLVEPTSPAVPSSVDTTNTDTTPQA